VVVIVPLYSEKDSAACEVAAAPNCVRQMSAAEQVSTVADAAAVVTVKVLQVK